MTTKAWRAIAIGEFILIIIAISLVVMYSTYKMGLLSEGVRGFLSVVANIGRLAFLLAGTTGWMMIIGFRGGDENERS